MPQTFAFTNPRHSCLSYTILLACPTFKPSFTESIHLFRRRRPTKRLPVHSPTYTLLPILSSPFFQYGLTAKPSENTFFNLFIHLFRLILIHSKHSTYLNSDSCSNRAPSTRIARSSPSSPIDTTTLLLSALTLTSSRIFLNKTNHHRLHVSSNASHKIKSICIQEGAQSPLSHLL